MTLKKILFAGVVGVVVLAALSVALLYYDRPNVAQGKAGPRHAAHNLAAHRSSGQVLSFSRVRQGSARTAHAAPAHRHPIRRVKRIVLLPPRAPLALRQIGGREPAWRTIAAGAWLNSTTLDIVVRMSSPAAVARLQPQVELRPAGQQFTGRPTAVGKPVAYHGRFVLGIVHLHGLRDGVAYHWRVRVHDLRGPNSRWITLPVPRGAHGALLRVHLGAPAAPRLFLVTAARPGDWVATRRLTLRWSPPADRSGIRGYSFTLARSPSARPLMRWRTAVSRATVHAGSDGLWYFTVRALSNAHSWGPPARLAVRIDTAVPRLRVLSAPAGPVNPRRAHPLLRLYLTRLARVTVDVLGPHGRVVRSILTSLHRPGYHLSISWDGLGMNGKPVPNGRYTLRITAAGRSGLTWQTSRILDALSRAPSFASYGLVATNPYYPSIYNPYNNDIDGPQVITAALDEPARVRIEAVHGTRVMQTWQLDEPQAGQVITATWDGSTVMGAQTPGGVYSFRAIAVDAAGNTTTTNLGWVTLDFRRIVISLNAQQLWALDGNKVLLSTYVTTGGPELPTPTGDFQIIDRESPFTFHSPYPPSSPFWYKDSPVNFALLFQWNGYFIHDAPWRSVYGPGTNAYYGTPGTNYTGTHGCVNVPYYPMAWLFNWATMYTPVEVRQAWAPS